MIHNATMVNLLSSNNTLLTSSTSTNVDYGSEIVTKTEQSYKIKTSCESSYKQILNSSLNSNSNKCDIPNSTRTSNTTKTIISSSLSSNSNYSSVTSTPSSSQTSFIHHSNINIPLTETNEQSSEAKVGGKRSSNLDMERSLLHKKVINNLNEPQLTGKAEALNRKALSAYSIEINNSDCSSTSMSYKTLLKVKKVIISSIKLSDFAL